MTMEFDFDVLVRERPRPVVTIPAVIVKPLDLDTDFDAALMEQLKNKPKDCICKNWPFRKLRNGSTHDKQCPEHQRWLAKGGFNYGKTPVDLDADFAVDPTPFSSPQEFRREDTDTGMAFHGFTGKVFDPESNTVKHYVSGKQVHAQEYDDSEPEMSPEEDWSHKGRPISLGDDGYHVLGSKENPKPSAETGPKETSHPIDDATEGEENAHEASYDARSMGSLLHGDDAYPAEEIGTPLPQGEREHVLGNDGIEENDKESQAQKEKSLKHVQKTANTTYGKLPDAAKAALKETAPNVAMFSTPAKLTAELVKVSPEAAERAEKGEVFHGAYLPDSKKLLLSKGNDDSLTPEIHAYEMAKASANGLDESPEWLKATDRFKDESLTVYAKNPKKAWGEFGRLVFEKGVSADALRQQYPEPTAVWEGYGLIPKSNKGEMQALVETFRPDASLSDIPRADADSAYSLKEATLATYSRLGRGSMEWLKDNVKLVGDWAQKTLALTPAPLRMAVTAVMRKVYYTHLLANAAAREVAKTRGMDDQKAQRLSYALTGADLILGGKILPLAAGAAAGAVLGSPLLATGAAIASSFLPVGSLAYIALTAGGEKSALDTFKRGAKAIKTLLSKKDKKADFEKENALEVLSNAVAGSQATDDQFWLACFLAAMDETQGDVGLSCELAEEASSGEGESDFEGQDDPFTDPSRRGAYNEIIAGQYGHPEGSKHDWIGDVASHAKRNWLPTEDAVHETMAKTLDEPIPPLKSHEEALGHWKSAISNAMKSLRLGIRPREISMSSGITQKGNETKPIDNMSENKRIEQVGEAVPSNPIGKRVLDYLSKNPKADFNELRHVFRNTKPNGSKLTRADMVNLLEFGKKVGKLPAGFDVPAKRTYGPTQKPLEDKIVDYIGRYPNANFRQMRANLKTVIDNKQYRIRSDDLRAAIEKLQADKKIPVIDFGDDSSLVPANKPNKSLSKPREVDPLGFYSPLHDAIANVKQQKMTPHEFRAHAAKFSGSGYSTDLQHKLNSKGEKEALPWQEVQGNTPKEKTWLIPHAQADILGLENMLKDKKSVTADELRKYVDEKHKPFSEVDQTKLETQDTDTSDLEKKKDKIRQTKDEDLEPIPADEKWHVRTDSHIHSTHDNEGDAEDEADSLNDEDRAEYERNLRAEHAPEKSDDQDARYRIDASKALEHVLAHGLKKDPDQPHQVDLERLNEEFRNRYAKEKYGSWIDQAKFLPVEGGAAVAGAHKLHFAPGDPLAAALTPAQRDQVHYIANEDAHKEKRKLLRNTYLSKVGELAQGGNNDFEKKLYGLYDASKNGYTPSNSKEDARREVEKAIREHLGEHGVGLEHLVDYKPTGNPFTEKDEAFWNDRNWRDIHKKLKKVHNSEHDELDDLGDEGAKNYAEETLNHMYRERIDTLHDKAREALNRGDNPEFDRITDEEVKLVEERDAHIKAIKEGVKVDENEDWTTPTWSIPGLSRGRNRIEDNVFESQDEANDALDEWINNYGMEDFEPSYYHDRSEDSRDEITDPEEIRQHHIAEIEKEIEERLSKRRNPNSGVKYDNALWQLPGEKKSWTPNEPDYNELHITAPEVPNEPRPEHGGQIPWQTDWNDGHSEYRHVQNPIARLRYNLRSDTEGNKVFHLDEIQGPTKQEQKKMPEYLKDRIYETGMKRAIVKAVENGADKLTWTTGAQQADRYGVRHKVDRIEWIPAINKDKNADPNKGKIIGWKDGQQIISESLPHQHADTLEQAVGDQYAEVLRKKAETGAASIEGDELEVNGHGHKKNYDTVIPNNIKGILKKAGVRVQDTQLPEDIHTEPRVARFAPGTSGETKFVVLDSGNNEVTTFPDTNEGHEEAKKYLKENRGKLIPSQTVHSIQLTPEIKDFVKRGFSSFADEEPVDKGVVDFSNIAIDLDADFIGPEDKTLVRPPGERLYRPVGPAPTAVTAMSRTAAAHSHTALEATKHAVTHSEDTHRSKVSTNAKLLELATSAHDNAKQGAHGAAALDHSLLFRGHSERGHEEAHQAHWHAMLTNEKAAREGKRVDLDADFEEGDHTRRPFDFNLGDHVQELPEEWIHRTYHPNNSKLLTEWKAKVPHENGEHFTLRAKPIAKSHWSVVFSDPKGSYEETGKLGTKAVPMLNKMLSGIHTFVGEKRPKEFSFFAEGEKRNKIYSRWADWLSKAHGYHLEKSIEPKISPDEPDTHNYNFTDMSQPTDFDLDEEFADFTVARVTRLIDDLKDAFKEPEKGRKLKATIKKGIIEGSHEVVDRWFKSKSIPKEAEALRKKFVEEQLSYLAAYVSDVYKVIVGVQPGRSAMYANSLRVLESQLLGLRAKQDGARWERRVLGKEGTSCSECVELARKGWRKFGSLPPIGSTPCKSNCGCRFEYSYSTKKKT